MQQPNISHRQAIKRTLRYLKGTLRYGIYLIKRTLRYLKGTLRYGIYLTPSVNSR